MIDVHTHILPRVDDGSKSISESIALLNMEREQGVDKIIATPHFYSHRHSLESFLDRRKYSFDKLMHALEITGGIEAYPSIHLGAEVYFFDGISKASILPNLCVEGTNILLLEMPFCQWDEKMYTEVKELIYERGLTIILAHVDRYVRFQKDNTYLRKLLSLPVVVQFNGECFLHIMKRRFPIHYMKAGHSVLLASDCHNLKKRMPNLEQASAYIQKKLGRKPLKRCDRLASQLFGDL